MVGKQVKHMHSVSKKKGKLHRFYLIEPNLHVDADKFAEGLIALKPVEEVLLSDGDYGFIVKVRLFDGKEPESVFPRTSSSHIPCPLFYQIYS